MSFHFTDGRLKSARKQPQSQAQGPVYFCGSPLPPALPGFPGSLGSLTPVGLRASCVSVSSHHQSPLSDIYWFFRPPFPHLLAQGASQVSGAHGPPVFLPMISGFTSASQEKSHNESPGAAWIPQRSSALGKHCVLTTPERKVQGQTPAVQCLMQALPRLQMAVLTLCPHRAKEIKGVGCRLPPMGTVIPPQRPTPMTSPPQGFTSKSPRAGGYGFAVYVLD